MDTSAALSLPASGTGQVRGLRLDPLLVLIIAVLAVASAAALVIVPLAGMRFESGSFFNFIGLAIAMLGLSAYCRFRKLDARIADAATVVGIGTFALLACGVISNAGLRLGAAPIDGVLARSDAFFGISVDTIVRSFAEHPWLIDALASIYNASGAAVVVLIAWSLISGRRAKAWELLATVVASMQVVALISIAAPAVGAMHYFGMMDLQGNGLPRGAGIYHLEAFARFHSGTDPLLRLSEMSGLVTFPSFHTVLALLATQALAETRLRWIAGAWSAAVIVSTIPIGGHYVTDLAAGFIIWAGCAWASRRLSTPSA